MAGKKEILNRCVDMATNIERQAPGQITPQITFLVTWK